MWPATHIYLMFIYCLCGKWKKSSQELYTVSVESMPQYAGGGGGSRCCKGGRVGKDLLCGVLIALAVICAAVAIFLVAFYVINGNNHHRTSFPLTRKRNCFYYLFVLIIYYYYFFFFLQWDRNWRGEDARRNGSSSSWERQRHARLFTFDTKQR